MSASLKSLFDELAADPSTGENLENDADFSALAVAAQGKPEQQYGTTIVAAEEPDWKDVQAQALVLLERSRDLRVMATLALAQLRLAGLRGFADVLSLITRLLDTQWDGVFPQLDPEDDNDPMMRSNAVLGVGEPARALRQLREYPLAVSARVGRVSWRTISAANGTIEPEPGTEKLAESAIVAAFNETDAAGLADLRDALAESLASLKAVGTTFDERAGYGAGPDLSRLEKLLGEMQKMCERYAPAIAADAPVEAVAEGAPAAALAPAAGVPSAAVTAVHTRFEAMRLLDLVCAYYERAEPSSPLPLLIQRAKRLADKSFIEILQDLAPDGVAQAQNVTGKAEE